MPVTTRAGAESALARAGMRSAAAKVRSLWVAATEPVRKIRASRLAMPTQSLPWDGVSRQPSAAARSDAGCDAWLGGMQRVHSWLWNMGDGDAIELVAPHVTCHAAEVPGSVIDRADIQCSEESHVLCRSARLASLHAVLEVFLPTRRRLPYGVRVSGQRSGDCEQLPSSCRSAQAPGQTRAVRLMGKIRTRERASSTVTIAPSSSVTP